MKLGLQTDGFVVNINSHSICFKAILMGYENSCLSVWVMRVDFIRRKSEMRLQ